MEYPKKSCIVEVKRGSLEARWTKAIYYMNGTTPTFAQYGSQIFDVADWRTPTATKKIERSNA